MADRDLMPAAATHDTPYGASDARAEVEAFMGEGWTFFSDEAPRPVWTSIRAYNCRLRIRVVGEGKTYRAAVDALKSAWRDAVRPWMEAAIEAKLDTADVDGYAPDEVVIARVLKEDSK